MHGHFNSFKELNWVILYLRLKCRCFHDLVLHLSVAVVVENQSIGLVLVNVKQIHALSKCVEVGLVIHIKSFLLLLDLLFLLAKFEIRFCCQFLFGHSSLRSLCIEINVTIVSE